MSKTELDGKYRVSTVSNYQGPVERRSDGETEIVDGKTERIDDNKVLWTSTFEVVSETEVRMTSVADPSDMRMARKGKDVRMSGQIEVGDEIIFLTMRSIVEEQ